MDLSKLKPMSQTPPVPPPPNETPDDTGQPAPPVAYHDPQTQRPPPREELGLVSIWISLVMGAISLLLGQRFGSWLVTELKGEPFHTGVEWKTDELAGSEVAYFDLSNHTALTEAGLFLLGIILIVDAGLMIIARRGFMSVTLIYVALSMVMVTLIFNLYVCVLVYQSGVLPLISLMAVLVAGIVFFSHFDSLKLLNRHRELWKRIEQKGASDVAE